MLANVTTRDPNVFDLPKDLDQRGERLDTVILEPPAFAKSKGAVEKAAPATTRSSSMFPRRST